VRTSFHHLAVVGSALCAAPLSLPAATPPGLGDVILNEYASDNTTSGSDFVELLTLTDHLDLRGLRLSDNELTGGGSTLNVNESVLTLGSDDYLGDVPRGTLIAVWTVATGVVTDTTLSPGTGDYSLSLTPGTGVTVGTDGLGGSTGVGLAVGGDAVYIYLAGPNGNSSGSDNVYLDFVSWETDNADAPPGLADLNLPSLADNAYFTGSTAANDLAAAWVRYDGPVDALPMPEGYTPGRPNPGQDLSGLRGGGSGAGVNLTQSDGNTAVAEGGANDHYTLALATLPAGQVTITATTASEVEISLDGVSYSGALEIPLTSQSPVTVYVRAIDDLAVEGAHSANIQHAITATSDADQYPTTLGISGVSVSIADNDTAQVARIRDIQGVAHLSPYAGQNVVETPGIVTAVARNGFYLQDPTPDANPATSEGIFVFTSSAPSVHVGDSLKVSGRVIEFRPGGSANNLTITEITQPTITRVGSGLTLPTPVVLGLGGRAIPTEIFADDAVNGTVEDAGGLFDPTNDGLDFFESLEGMLVQVNDALVTGGRNRFGEIVVLADAGVGATSLSIRGGSLASSYADFNPERIFLDDELIPNPPSVRVGQQFPGPVVGVLSYSFSAFKVLNIAPLPTATGGVDREVTTLVGGVDQLTLATFNVENLDMGDGAQRFADLAGAIVDRLGAPDILNLEEVQDNNGPVNDSVVDASSNLQTLINAIVDEGGPTYEYRQIDPVDDQDGGEPGGNIRVAFLFNPGRVSFVDRAGGTSTGSVLAVNNSSEPELSFSPGRIDPLNPAFNNSRKPLVGEFFFQGYRLFVIGNHFNSKGGDQPLYGPLQPPVRPSEIQRQQQASLVANFVQSLTAIEPNANVVVLGDLNDFEFSPSVGILKTAGLIATVEQLPVNERYTYVFEGNSQTLDHVMVSASLAPVVVTDIVHFNSEFPDQLSDHDPVLIRLTLDGTAPNLLLNCVNSASARRYTFSVVDAVDIQPAVYIRDTASSFIAGPYRNGDSVLVRTNPRQAPFARETAGYAALIQLRGKPVFQAVDASGNMTGLITCP